MKKITSKILSMALMATISSNIYAQNTLTGTSAGAALTTGFDNTFTGHLSGYNTTSGYYNTFAGMASGQLNSTGHDNTFVGRIAGQLNSTGTYNSCFGEASGLGNATGSFNVALGSESNFTNATGSYNTAVGSRAGYSNTGSYNTFIGYNAESSTASLSNATAIGYNASVSANNALILGSNANIGIGTSAPAYKLQISGVGSNAAKPGSSTWTIASDKRLKKDITEFREGLSVLEKINPVSFKYNGEANMPTTETYIGIIAQEMKEIAPYTVGKFSYQDSLGNKTEYLDYDANAVTYIMINAIKELSAEVKSLKEQLANLNPESSTQSSIEEKSYLLNDAKLEQNAPNPFNENTCIKYYFPENASKGQINIYSMNGSLVKSIELNEKGNSSVTIQANLLHTGIYNYELVIDNSVIEKLQMILTK